jgi:hypothetical protein
MRLTHRERWLTPLENPRPERKQKTKNSLTGLTIGLLVLAAVWALFVLSIRPAIERIETLNRVIPEKQRELDEIRAKSAQYLSLQAKLDDIERKVATEAEGFELLTFLETITTELGFAEKVATMKQEVLQLDSNYCEFSVETKLENLTLKQLIEFLLKIKSSKHFLWIKSLYTKKSTTNPNLLDTVIQISVRTKSGMKVNQSARFSMLDS